MLIESLIALSEQKLRVFISSNQKEFDELRKRLRDKLLGTSFLTPIVLELEGAKSFPVRETSLKSAEKCDIFIGILGSRYSKLVEEEYRKAVSNYRPCLIYVKKVKKRNHKIKTLINNEIRPNFKYHEFEDEAKLIDQIINDLNRFLLEIMAEGLRVSKQRRKKTLKKQISMQQLQKAMVPLTETSALQFLQDAKDACDKHSYVEAILTAELAIENCLQYVLIKSGAPSKDLSSFGLMVQAATKFGFLTNTTRNTVMDFRRTRNKMVHMALRPTKREVISALKMAEDVIKSLLNISRIRTEISIQSLNVMSEEEMSAIIPQLDIKNIQKIIQKIFDEISLLSNWKEEASNENLFDFLKLAIRLREEKILLFGTLFNWFTRATVKFGKEKILTIFAEITKLATIKNRIAKRKALEFFIFEFEKSASFEAAGINAEIILNLLPVLSSTQLSRVIQAAASNDQIYYSYKARGYLQKIISYCKGKVEGKKIKNLRSKLVSS